MRAEFHSDAIQRFEGVCQQQQLALSVQRGALHALAIPGGPDFHPPVRRVHIHVRGHPNRLAGCSFDDSEGKHRALRQQSKPSLDLSTHFFRCRHRGVPEIPEFAVFDGFDEVVVMPLRQRLQRRV